MFFVWFSSRPFLIQKMWRWQTNASCLVLVKHMAYSFIQWKLVGHHEGWTAKDSKLFKAPLSKTNDGNEVFQSRGAWKSWSFFFDHPLARSRVLQWKKVMKTRWKAVFRFYDSMLVIEVFFLGGIKSSHSDLPKGTNKYLLKEPLGVAGVEKFWSNWTFAWLQWRSLQGIQILLWLSWWFHPTFGVFFQEEPCRVVVMKKPLISWAPEDGLKLVDLPSLKVTPKAPEKWMVGNRSGFLLGPDQFSGARFCCEF